MSDRAGERRRYHRVVFRATVALKTPERQWFVRIFDLSLKGMLLEEPADWPPETQACAVELPLGDEHRIRLSGRLVRRVGGLMGFEWAEIDLDSLIDLRRLLELNLGDEALIDRDLANLFAAAEG